MMTPTTSILLTASNLDQILSQLAEQIAQEERRGGEFFLVGIHTRGIPLARRLARLLGKDPQRIGILDINLYRDDLARVSGVPELKETHLPFSPEGARILLVDDVLFTGRTIRSALDALVDLGRPRQIQLLALIDRGGRELPIQADFIGKKVEIHPWQKIQVAVQETDGCDQVEVLEKESGRDA